MPVFQLLSCTLNPVNLLLFTLACSSYSLVSIYLSLTLPCSSTRCSLSIPLQYISPSHALAELPCSSTIPLYAHPPLQSNSGSAQAASPTLGQERRGRALLSASAIASVHTPPPPPPVTQLRQVAQS